MREYEKIIFVDEHGTCRAPMAAGIFREQNLQHPILVEARGLVTLFPEPLNQKAEAVMISNGIQFEQYASSQFVKEDVTENTLVIVMEHEQREKALAVVGNDVSVEDVQVLNELIGDELEIMNPYGGTLQSYGLCFETMRKAIKKLRKMMNEEEE